MRQITRPFRLWGKGLPIFADLQFVYDKFAMMPAMQSFMDKFVSRVRRIRLPMCRLPLRASGFALERGAK